MTTFILPLAIAIGLLILHVHDLVTAPRDHRAPSAPASHDARLRPLFHSTRS